MTENVDDDSICSRSEKLVAEFEQSRDPDSTEIGRQFAQLQRTMFENNDILSCNEGMKPINRLKNRYKDVLPYDKYRVSLQSNDESDYINASFIEDFYGKRRYIAAQGPIDESIIDFLRMIWDFQITSIICTANDTEAGRFKFRRYWPDEEKSLQFGSYQIIKDETNDKSYSCKDYEIRSLIIIQGENQRHVLLYHFLHWLDHDIPNNEGPILELLLRLYQDSNPSLDTPILVHCSAGCGRTGSIIAIDLCRLLLNDQNLFLSKDYQSYPIFKIATHIRQFRIALIQTLKQYLFVYKMFIFLMKSNGNVSLCSTINNNENQSTHSLSTRKPSPPSTISSFSRRPSGPLQIKLRNPPIGRRLLNGINISNTPSPTTSPPEFFPSSSKLPSSNNTLDTAEPSPIPPRSSLMNTTNQYREGQFVHPDETSIKTGRNHIRSRNIRQKEPTRSDSVDTLSVPTSNRHHHHQISIEQGANSD